MRTIKSTRACGLALAMTLLAAPALAASVPNVFVAGLTPSQEPGTPTVGMVPSSCFASFDLNGPSTLRYRILCFNITGVIAAHVHGPASADVNAPPLVSLYEGEASGNVDGQLSRGTITRGVELTEEKFDELLEAMRNDMAYVNVHTTANTSGEVRGQVTGLRVLKRTVLDVF